ncbi:hypothetical protein BGX28_007053 [Mortierella sp. GBA30]|nr:hypothetical protein BGX28_007053 [Mortierella sp. GBA30]
MSVTDSHTLSATPTYASVNEKGTPPMAMTPTHITSHSKASEKIDQTASQEKPEVKTSTSASTSTEATVSTTTTTRGDTTKTSTTVGTDGTTTVLTEYPSLTRSHTTQSTSGAQVRQSRGQVLPGPSVGSVLGYLTGLIILSPGLLAITVTMILTIALQLILRAYLSSAMSSSYPNFPLLSLPIAAGLAYAPHFIRALIVVNATKRWNNINPRGQLEKVESRMSKAAWAMAKRAEGAHQNGLETLPVFFGAVLAALHAGVAKDTVTYYSGFFIVSRFLFNIVYILNTNQLSALIRSGIWTSGMFACVKLFLAAAATKY